MDIINYSKIKKVENDVAQHENRLEFLEEVAFSGNVGIVDNLNSTDTTKALSANQGKILNDNKLNKSGDTMTGLLSVPSFKLNYNNSPLITGFSKDMDIDANLSEIEVMFTNFNNTIVGTINISISSSAVVTNATGSISKKIDILLLNDGSILYQNTNYTDISQLMSDNFAISDIYIKNGKPCFKILQRNNGRYPVYCTMKFYGAGTQQLNTFTVSDVVVSTDTFVKPTIYKEFIINSGFASDWSGSIRIRQNPNDKLTQVLVNLIKNSDITAGLNTLYTLPIGYRPINEQNNLINLYTTGYSSLSNSFSNLGIKTNGEVQIYPVTSTNLSFARAIYVASFTYYAQ